MSDSAPLPRDWDPKPQERTWYRETVTGQSGYLVRREGRDMVRMDRGPDVEIVRPLNGEWQPEKNHKPLTPAHVGQVCFEADRCLSRFNGNANNVRRNWLDLTDKQRQMWIETGPQNDPMRKGLYEAVRASLGRFAQ